MLQAVVLQLYVILFICKYCIYVVSIYTFYMLICPQLCLYQTSCFLCHYFIDTSRPNVCFYIVQQYESINPVPAMVSLHYSLSHSFYHANEGLSSRSHAFAAFQTYKRVMLVTNTKTQTADNVGSDNALRFIYQPQHTLLCGRSARYTKAQ